MADKITDLTPEELNALLQTYTSQVTDALTVQTEALIVAESQAAILLSRAAQLYTDAALSAARSLPQRVCPIPLVEK